MNTRRYPVIIEKTSTGYSAVSHRTSLVARRPVIRNRTLASHFEMRLLLTLKRCVRSESLIPEPTSSVHYVEVAA